MQQYLGAFQPQVQHARPAHAKDDDRAPRPNFAPPRVPLSAGGRLEGRPSWAAKPTVQGMSKMAPLDPRPLMMLPARPPERDADLGNSPRLMYFVDHSLFVSPSERIAQLYSWQLGNISPRRLQVWCYGFVHLPTAKPCV